MNKGDVWGKMMIKGEFKDVKGNTVRGNLGWLLKSIRG